MGTAANERRQLLRDIQTVGFVVVEAQLFLDTHPDCADALDYFNYYNQLYMQLVADYESKFGPLTVNGVQSNSEWTWVNEPWPWEKEA
ncbi:MAG: spore coat protein CotJB [Firmicutes bacterium]|nr:spore coat protein CotJB [Bacillota bacterium]